MFDERCAVPRDFGCGGGGGENLDPLADPGYRRDAGDADARGVRGEPRRAGGKAGVLGEGDWSAGFQISNWRFQIPDFP